MFQEITKACRDFLRWPCVPSSQRFPNSGFYRLRSHTLLADPYLRWFKAHGAIHGCLRHLVRSPMIHTIIGQFIGPLTTSIQRSMIRVLNCPMRAIQRSLNRPMNLVNIPMNCLVRLKGPAIPSNLAAAAPYGPLENIGKVIWTRRFAGQFTGWFTGRINAQINTQFTGLNTPMQASSNSIGSS